MSMPLSLSASASSMQPARNSCSPFEWLGLPARKRTFFLADAVKAVSILSVKSRVMALTNCFMIFIRWSRGIITCEGKFDSKNFVFFEILWLGVTCLFFIVLSGVVLLIYCWFWYSVSFSLLAMMTAAHESPKTLTAVRLMSRSLSTANSARMALLAPGMPELFMMMRMATMDADGTPATPMLVRSAEMTTSI